MVDGSSLRSICVPTSRKGVFGQWWVISGTHWERDACSYVRGGTEELDRENKRNKSTLRRDTHLFFDVFE